MPDLKPAEQAVLDVIGPRIRHGYDSDGTPVQEWPWWDCDRTASAVVAAVRPLIAAQALRDAADAMPFPSGMVRADADVWLHHRADDLEGRGDVDN